MVKIMVKVQKRVKGASVEADFLHGENIDHEIGLKITVKVISTDFSGNIHRK